MVGSFHRGARLLALGSAFVAGAAAGLAYEGARARSLVAVPRIPAAVAVVTALAGRSGPTGGVLPGIDAVVGALDPALGRARRRVCAGGGAMSEPVAAVAPSGEVALALTFQGSIDCGAGRIDAAGGGADFDALVLGLTPSGHVAWSRHIGGAGPQALSAIAFEPWGGVLVAGSFQGTIDLGGPPLSAASDLDILVARLDPDGRPVWQRRYGLSGRNFGADLAVSTAGRIYLLARSASDIDLGAGRHFTGGEVTSLVAQLDPQGRTLWSRAIGGASGVVAARLWPAEGGGAVVVSRAAAVSGGAGAEGEGVLSVVRLTSSGHIEPSGRHPLVVTGWQSVLDLGR